MVPEKEQHFSSKADGELRQRMRSVAVPDVPAVSLMLMTSMSLWTVPFTEPSAAVPRAAMVLPEYTSYSLGDQMGCAVLLCAGNGFWGLLGAVLPGITLWEGEVDMICTLLQDDKLNSKGFLR